MAGQRLRLGLNIDHVATLRNARGGVHPDPLRAAEMVLAAGADSLTFHLREDRRHIRDADVLAFRAGLSAPLNLEMAATDEMQRIALEVLPEAVCLVPERRQELTTEGGLDVAGAESRLTAFIAPLSAAGIRVSLFIDPDPAQVAAAIRSGAGAVELHTGSYAEACQAGDAEAALVRLRQAAAALRGSGLECHAGHGLSFDNVTPVARIPEVVELNIGHYLIGEALFVGLAASVARMRAIMDDARA